MVFLMEVKPDHIDQYREAHRNVWPEVEEACRRVGMRNYSIFMAETHLIAYFESDDCEKSLAELAQQEALQRWWRYMDPVMAPEPPLSKAFEEVFHM
ncbi:MAG: L-rhamnose mutarotase [Thermaerobacter sp.]|nr:L-rhamnose mutarotase [Thermaerobacter sp.]